MNYIVIAFTHWKEDATIMENQFCWCSLYLLVNDVKFLGWEWLRIAITAFGSKNDVVDAVTCELQYECFRKYLKINNLSNEVYTFTVRENLVYNLII